MNKINSHITCRSVKKYKLFLLMATLGATTSHYSHAQQITLPSESTKKEYQLELERQKKILTEQGREIENLKRLIKDVNSKTVNTPQNRNTSAKKNKKSNLVNKPVGKAPPKKPTHIDVSAIPKLSTNNSGVLTKAGTLIIEPRLGYSYTDSNRVFLDAYSFLPALVVGLIDVREIKRHTIIGSIGSRYGLTDRWEVDLKVSYIGRNDSQRSRPISIGASQDEIFTASGGDIGDLEFSTRYQLNSGMGGGAIYVFNLVATIPTGTSPFEVEYVESAPGTVFPIELPTGSGYYSVQPSLTAIYPTDPGVLFGNISYGNNFETDEEVGTVDPGDSLGFSFGLGLSLNERTAISLSYSHKHVLKSKIDNVKINGSELDIGQFIIGYSFNYSAQTNFNLSLNIGVTDDAPDMRLNFRVPMMF
ncbi:transporter [Colwellia ponticola]|uniref:Transporter n=1 Tax=Colwellia ponticola TaxID=2304625 RepID=A0A8H2JMD4_9GAMM|nr:transporter [Colwellia ponticola]TMM44760.1 transporter [Colwellia ponticola]